MDVNRRRWPAIVIAVLIAVAAVRMAATFRVFSATNDEATHVGAGLIEYHRYTLHRVNPPLPRVGVRDRAEGGRDAHRWERAFVRRAVARRFLRPRRYEHDLVLARIGNLLFFIIAAMALGAWDPRELGEWEGVLAVLFFTMEPVILGYSALATHDMPAAAGVAVAMWAMSRWMDRRTRGAPPPSELHSGLQCCANSRVWCSCRRRGGRRS